MANKKSSHIPQSNFDNNESECLFTFTDEPISDGKCISEFTFEPDKDLSSHSSDLPILNTSNTNYSSFESSSNISQDKVSRINNYAEKLFDNRTIPIPNGAAPPINDEIPTVRRSYIFRASTIRKLNELKSIHPDINACVSTIVDVALEHYYTYITKEGGKL